MALMPVMSGLIGFTGPTADPVTYVGLDETELIIGEQNPFTFTNKSAAGPFILLSIAGGNNKRTISSVTLDGDAFTQLHTVVDGDGKYRTNIYILENGPYTNKSLVVTFDADEAACLFVMASFAGLLSTTVIDVDGFVSNGSPAEFVSLTNPGADGMIFANLYIDHDDPHTWTNATEIQDGDHDNNRFSTAYRLGNPPADVDPDGGSADHVAAAVSMR